MVKGRIARNLENGKWGSVATKRHGGFCGLVKINSMEDMRDCRW